MSKKHFIRLAEYIRDDASFTERQLRVIAEFCKEQNPRFNHSRWVGYIRGENGPNGGKR